MVKATFIPCALTAKTPSPYSEVAAKPGEYGSGSIDFRYLSVFGIVVSITETSESGSIVAPSNGTFFRRLAREVDVTVS